MAALEPTPARIRRPLLRWFDRNKRAMPWRGTLNPYRIWVSEIMLQQTRVGAVVPYYRRFIGRFPSVESLARARNILPYWAGLGYYSRARNLHRAAKEIARSHGGRFPRRLEDALKLPGVGGYTARAVLSIAFGQKLAVVDGNAARVLIRLFALRRAQPNNRKDLQPLADRLISPSRPGEFNQAMMELGATVCLPRRPRCPDCPLERICAARSRGKESALPVRSPKRQRPVVRLDVFVPRRGGKVLLVREPRGYFSGLWHFPYREANGQKQKGRPLAAFTHVTTMRDLALEVFLVTAGGTARSNPPRGAGEARWVQPARAARLGVGAATRRILESMKRKEQPGGRTI